MENQLNSSIKQKGRYGRFVGEIFVESRNINLTMIQEGQAVVYRQYLKNCSGSKELLAGEAIAKSKKLGFWNQLKPVMPWDFRKAKKLK